MAGFDLGRIGAWAHLDSLSAADARAWARRVDELGFGTLWVPETVGREPLTLLGMLAGDTSRMNLGTSIVSIWGHDAQSTRMAALTLAEATGGRFVLGLGVSHPHLAAKLRGHSFDRPVSRMREFLAAYRSAIYKGPMADAGEPPILVAALRERMTDLAATEADGAFPYLVTTDRVRWMRDRLDAASPERRAILAVTLPFAMDDLDREAARAYLKPYLRTPTYHASWELQGFDASDWEQPGSDRLVDAMVVTGSAADARQRVDDLHAAGADHVAIIPIGPDGTTEHLPALEAIGA
ncbi:MAG TPA: LLM class flavin-dependent oxidoreductase [Candidatus Limnocylindria bacterium]|nr:LLM class flavin-dependent oxidoreductase [Candidatus Limnocylindria bacterium]